ncbi:hypothetical protein VTO42DRAFT_4430 [Malbranchea cinnamomea]
MHELSPPVYLRPVRWTHLQHTCQTVDRPCNPLCNNIHTLMDSEQVLTLLKAEFRVDRTQHPARVRSTLSITQPEVMKSTHQSKLCARAVRIKSRGGGYGGAGDILSQEPYILIRAVYSGAIKAQGASQSQWPWRRIPVHGTIRAGPSASPSTCCGKPGRGDPGGRIALCFSVNGGYVGTYPDRSEVRSSCSNSTEIESIKALLLPAFSHFHSLPVVNPRYCD